MFKVFNNRWIKNCQLKTNTVLKFVLNMNILKGRSVTQILGSAESYRYSHF